MRHVRDEEGLTDKQRQSLPLVAEASSLRAGALKVVEAGIVSSIEYWYKDWWSDPNYVEAVKKARIAVFGELKGRTLSKLLAFHDDAVNSLIAGALKQGPGQLGFLRLYFEIEGFLAQNPLLPTSPPNSGQWGGMSPDNGRIALPQRLAKHLESRNELLRVLRLNRPSGTEVAVVKSNDGGSNGNGNGS